MREFLLNLNSEYQISLFSVPHIILTLITLMLVLLIINKRKIFVNLSDNKKKIIRLSFGILLLINLFVRRGSYIYYGVYDWHYNLDINFCNFTSIIFIFYCFSNNKKVLNICFHMAFVGPLLLIILPSSNLNPLGYSFYSFILIHHIVFIFAFIFIFMDNFKSDESQMFDVIRFLIIYYTVIFTFDYIYSVNYNYPLTFVNSLFINQSFFCNIFDNNIIVFIIYFFVITIMLVLGNKVLKIITN